MGEEYMKKRCLAICGLDGIWHLSIANNEVQVKPDRTIWQGNRYLSGPHTTLWEALWRAECICRTQTLAGNADHVDKVVLLPRSILLSWVYFDLN